MSRHRISYPFVDADNFDFAGSETESFASSGIPYAYRSASGEDFDLSQKQVVFRAIARPTIWMLLGLLGRAAKVVDSALDIGEVSSSPSVDDVGDVLQLSSRLIRGLNRCL